MTERDVLVGQWHVGVAGEGAELVVRRLEGLAAQPECAERGQLQVADSRSAQLVVEEGFLEGRVVGDQDGTVEPLQSSGTTWSNVGAR